MMSDEYLLQIGRVGRSIPQDGLGRWDSRGDRVSVEFFVSIGPLSRAVTVRQQVLGLLDADEDIVPVTWEADPGINGFYRVIEAEIIPDPQAYLHGSVHARLTLERVRGFTAPLFESRVIGYPRADTAGITSRPWHAVPAAAKGYETNTLTPTQRTRVSATGDVAVLFMSDTSYYDASPQYFLTPEAWYAGAATLTVQGGEVVGKEPVNSTTGWVLSNGLIRLIGETTGWFRTEKWDGTKWTSSGTWSFSRRIDSANLTPLEAPHALTVLRNGPDSVVIRLTADAASSVPGSRFPVTVDIDLRRGALVADIILSTRGSYAWRIITPMTNVSSSGTDWIAQNGFVGIRQDAHASVQEGGRMNMGVVGAATQMNVGIGYHGTGDDAPASLAQQWAAHQRESVRVVVR